MIPAALYATINREKQLRLVLIKLTPIIDAPYAHVAHPRWYLFMGNWMGLRPDL